MTSVIFRSVGLNQKFRTVIFFFNYAFRLQYSNTQHAISTPEYMLIYSANMEMNMKLLTTNSGEEVYLKKKTKLTPCNIFLSD